MQVMTTLTPTLTTTTPTNNNPHSRSDHASWNRAGYPSSYPFESLEANQNPYIHSSNDVVDRLNMNHAVAVASVALSYVVEMALDV